MFRPTRGRFTIRHVARVGNIRNTASANISRQRYAYFAKQQKAKAASDDAAPFIVGTIGCAVTGVIAAVLVMDAMSNAFWGRRV